MALISLDAARGAMAARRVIIVDDEPAILTSTAALLTASGCEVLPLNDPALVAATVREWRPHALLQDARMPGLDLPELVSSVRAADPLVDIVLFSAGMDTQERALALGLDAWLEKPFRVDELLRAVKAQAPEAMPSAPRS